MVQNIPIQLKPYDRGYHLITDIINNSIGDLPKNGMFHLYICHTSAALTINENADPSVRTDFENVVNYIVPENLPFLQHTMEGPDDMPAHIKAAFIGTSISIPIINHCLHLGTWQGIYLCEFRNHASARSLIASIYY